MATNTIPNFHFGFYSDDFYNVMSWMYTTLGDDRNLVNKTASVTVSSDVKLVRDFNGEIVNSFTESSYGWLSKHSIFRKRRENNAAVLDWFGWCLKETVRKSILQNHEEYSSKDVADLWYRCNDKHYVLDDENMDNPVNKISIAEIYCMYDILRGRKNLERKYPKTLIEKVIGKQRDPISTEAERARHEEEMKIRNEYELKIKNTDVGDITYRSYYQTTTPAYDEGRAKYEVLKKEFDEKVIKLQEELKAKYNEIKKNLIAERDAKIAELNNMTSGISDALAFFGA